MKIEDIVLEEKHVGEEVTFYEPKTGSADAGHISSWNDLFIFVKYKSSGTSQATRPNELYWGDREGEFNIKFELIKAFDLENILGVNDFIIYISGESDTNLNVSVHFDNEIIAITKCITNGKNYMIPIITDESKKKIRRKIQISKLVNNG